MRPREERHDDPEEQWAQKHAEVRDVLNGAEPTDFAAVEAQELEDRHAEAAEYAEGQRVDDERNALEERGAHRRHVDAVAETGVSPRGGHQNDGPQRLADERGQRENRERSVVMKRDE